MYRGMRSMGTKPHFRRPFPPAGDFGCGVPDSVCGPFLFGPPGLCLDALPAQEWVEDLRDYTMTITHETLPDAAGLGDRASAAQ